MYFYPNVAARMNDLFILFAKQPLLLLARIFKEKINQKRSRTPNHQG